MARSAGLLVCRQGVGGPEALLGHPGGPLWRKRDLGAWTIPKGLVEAGEEPFAAALREFREETGLPPPPGPFVPLDPVRQRGGKQVFCWAVQADIPLEAFAPGAFQMVWPPRSGRLQSFPELDQLRYFAMEDALTRILPAQAPMLSQAVERLVLLS